MDLDFHRRVREGYLEIARADKSRVVVLDGGRAPDAVHADVVRAVSDLLARRGGAGGA
jgi:dTMP kinase